MLKYWNCFSTSKRLNKGTVNSLVRYSVLYLAITIVLVFCDAPGNAKDQYDYSIEQELGCFCPQGGKWVKLFVAADTIAAAQDLASGSQLSNLEWMPYKTVKGLFEEISNHDTSIFEIRITMDTIFNYPSYLYFNPKTIVHGDTAISMEDAQLAYTTRNFIYL